MNHILIALILFTAGFVLADSKPFKGKAYPIPGKIEAEYFDEGKPGVAYRDNDVKNSGANYRGPTPVDIEQRPPMPPMGTESAGRARASGSTTL